MPIVVRFYGRFVFVTRDDSEHQVLAVNPAADAATLPVPIKDHQFLLTVRRDRVKTTRHPDFEIAVGGDPSTAEHSVWRLTNLSAEIAGGGTSARLDETDADLADLGKLANGKGVFDVDRLRPGGLVTGVIRLKGLTAATRRIRAPRDVPPDEFKCVLVPLGSPDDPGTPLDRPLADLVEITLALPSVRFAHFEITAGDEEIVFVNFSNLCCQETEPIEFEFAALYRVLTGASQPNGQARLIPKTVPVLFPEVDCYKAAKITV